MCAPNTPICVTNATDTGPEKDTATHTNRAAQLRNHATISNFQAKPGAPLVDAADSRHTYFNITVIVAATGPHSDSVEAGLYCRRTDTSLQGRFQAPMHARTIANRQANWTCWRAQQRRDGRARGIGFAPLNESVETCQDTRYLHPSSEELHHPSALHQGNRKHSQRGAIQETSDPLLGARVSDTSRRSRPRRCKIDSFFTLSRGAPRNMQHACSEGIDGMMHEYSDTHTHVTTQRTRRERRRKEQQQQQKVDASEQNSRSPSFSPA